MQNFVLSLESQFPSIYSQSKNCGGITSAHSSHSSSISSLGTGSTITGSNVTSTTVSLTGGAGSEEILPNKLPLKRRLAEFRFGRDGGSVSIGKKNGKLEHKKFKDITTAFTVYLHPDGIILDPGSVGPLPYGHPTVLHLLNSINTGSLPLELFLTLLEQSHLTQQQLFYDGCVVVGVVEWRPGMTLTIGNLSSAGTRPINNHAVQWTRRVDVTSQNNSPAVSPELHKVLLKPTADCWQHALSFMSSLPDGEKYARILEDEESLLEFERQLILINEPVVCLDPSPMVMYAMNALYFDHQKHRLFEPLTAKPTPQPQSVYDELDQTLMNFAALKPNRPDQQSPPPPVTSSPTVNPRFRRITLIESIQDRDRRRATEPIYGIDHRRQFVKNRQPLPPSSFVPANWRPFKTIRYEREITSSTNSQITSGQSTSPNTLNNTLTNSQSLAKLYYCVNVFYAPPPTFPPIQLFLQVGTSPDTSTSGFLHRLQFPNLIETENYLQNLRNLLLIENGNCNLKVVTDISTTTTTSSTNTANTGVNVAANANVNNLRKGPVGQGNGTVPGIPPTTNTQQQQQQQQQQQPATGQQYQLTPHQILQLNQQRSANSSKESIKPPTTTTTTTNNNNNNNNNPINKQQF